jgi:hypothetical protein
MKAGAIDFLEKPYAEHALLGSIETAFGKESHPDRDYDVADAVRRVAMLSPRAGCHRLTAGKPAEQVDPLQSRDQRAHGGGPPRPDVGAVRRASAGGRYPSRCYGDAGRQ